MKTLGTYSSNIRMLQNKIKNIIAEIRKVQVKKEKILHHKTPIDC